MAASNVQNPSELEGLIFISWAGETSRRVGNALRDLIRNTIQTANPWMSDSDLNKGARWRKDIETKLNSALAGVVVLTPGNRPSGERCIQLASSSDVWWCCTKFGGNSFEGQRE